MGVLRQGWEGGRDGAPVWRPSRAAEKQKQREHAGQDRAHSGVRPLRPLQRMRLLKQHRAYTAWPLRMLCCLPACLPIPCAARQPAQTCAFWVQGPNTPFILPNS